jgi:hypothetical protein
VTRRPGDDLLVRELPARITERDRAICDSLHEHRVLTTFQLAELHFNGIERARKRLEILHQLHVLERFRPYHPNGGSSPYHYTLDRLGAELVAAGRGIDLADLAWSRGDILRLAASPQLRHLTEASGFVTRLARALRQTQSGTLEVWWGQRRCAQAWGELVRPDAYLRLALTGGRLEAWVEWDRGTENRRRLQDKLDRYEELAAALERPVTLLLVLAGVRREREAHRALQPAADVAWVSTTAERHRADPLARNWLAAGAERRVALTELAASHEVSTGATSA